MRRAFTITIAAGALRLVIAALTPLFPDEAYYWTWSRHLAGGYFDHPPVIAWLIRAGTLVAGDTPLGVRLFPGIVGTVAALFLCSAAGRLAGERAALIAALVFAAIPLSAAGLILATPDVPALAAGAATCYAVLRALEHPRRTGASLRWWCIAGVALGLAVASKYTAVLLPVGILVALLVRRNLQARLYEPGPYVATAISLLVFSPVILWNASHEWISFTFQLHHGLASVGGSVIRRELEFLGGQIGLVSPVIFTMIVIAAVRPAKDPPSLSLLSPIAFVILGFYAYSATKRRVEPNWPALAYLPGVLLLATRASTRRWDSWLRAGVVIAGALTLVVYVSAFIPILPVSARRDPVARSAAWDYLAREVNRIYEPRLSRSSSRTHVSANGYQEASALAFYMPTHPETYSLNLAARPNQFDLWPGFPQRARPMDALIFVGADVAGEDATITSLRPHFTSVALVDHIVLARNGDPVKALRIWMLEGWLGTWPRAEVRSRP